MRLVNPVEYYGRHKKAAVFGLRRGMATQSIVVLFHGNEIFNIPKYFWPDARNTH
jgi:hypothetical protein